MKRIMITALFIGAVIIGRAQRENTSSSYTTALGVKIYPTGITIKSFIKPDRALEGIAYFYNYGFRATGLYEIHSDIEGVDGL